MKLERQKQTVLRFTHRENMKRAKETMKFTQLGKKPVKVILDSNALFVPLQFKIDIFDGLEQLLERSLELILLSPVKRELEAIVRKGAPKMRKNASHALKLADKCKYIEVDAPDSALADDVIVKIAEKWKSPVFTNDRQLKKRLRDISVPVIYVRQKSRLEIDGMI
jgi:rRNA-processing protein FCF1